jgi:hypothetical protein
VTIAKDPESIRHDQIGLAIAMHAAEPARVIERLPPVFLGNLDVLANLSRPPATRTGVAFALDSPGPWIASSRRFWRVIF